MLRLIYCLLLTLALTSNTAAQTLRPFNLDSLSKIEAEHGQHPFILSFWSFNCPPCRDELTLLGQLKKHYPGLDLVLVSTDSPEDAEDIQSALAQINTLSLETWVFADSFTERLRFEVDKKWFGELPRTYFYAPGEPRTALSGTLDLAAITHWIEQHAGRPRNE